MMSDAHKGKKIHPNTLKALIKANTGHHRKASAATKEKLRISHLGNKSAVGHTFSHTIESRNKISRALIGDGCASWKGGITPLYISIAHSFKARLWRSDVFHRDDFTCQKCFKKGGKLNAHHIKRFADILREYNITTFEQAMQCEELWDINNGITYCKDCHKKEHSKSVK